MSRLNDTPSAGKKFIIWTVFVLFVILSWALAALFLITGGWSPCSEAGTCASERIGAIVIVLLLPLQAGLAAFIWSRLKARLKD